jgi:non-ribosomal peptide synthetase component F
LSHQETQAADSRSLSESFERAAELHHFRKALGSGAWQPTYRELNETADRLAQALLCRGGAPTDRVAVLMRQDGPLIAAILAVLKAPRIAVVLDSNDPAARLKQQMENAEPAVVLYQATHGGRTGSNVPRARCRISSREGAGSIFPLSGPVRAPMQTLPAGSSAGAWIARPRSNCARWRVAKARHST